MQDTEQSKNQIDSSTVKYNEKSFMKTLHNILLFILKFGLDIIYFARKILIGCFLFLKLFERVIPISTHLYHKLAEKFYLDEVTQKRIKSESSRSKSDRVVYTVLTGDYDNLISQYYYNPHWDYICLTDNKDLIENGHSFWKIVPLEMNYENIAKKSRIPKILAHKFLQDYKYSLYIDANIDILSPKVFRNIDKLINSGEKFAITKHYLRDCIYEEMLACMQYRKEDAGNILKLYAKYKEENFPSNYGLTENNVIFREHNDAEVIKLMEDWWYMVENYSKRDQLSLMYVCWKNNFKISSLFKKPLRFCIRDIFILYKHKADKK